MTVSPPSVPERRRLRDLLIESYGPSPSFPDGLDARSLPEEIEGSVHLLVGSQVPFGGLERPDAAVVLVELGDESLGEHIGEATSVEGSKIVGFSRFRLGSELRDVVELVVQLATSPEAIKVARIVFEYWGMRTLVCRDVPGRILNRLLVPFINQALSAAERGLASVETIDEAIRLGLGHSEGPIERVNRIGLERHYDLALRLYQELGDQSLLPAHRSLMARRHTSAVRSDTPPLAGLLVVDFTTLLPGPLATLVLARAGARVIKIERPGVGDEMRSYGPRFGPASANFALLNSGKELLVADLKVPDQAAKVMQLVLSADILVEQFRPGVLDRLGFGYSSLAKRNPGLIYCSITGFGQTGPYRRRAAHDLNYLAETGLLSLTAGADGSPLLPPTLIADIGAGSYPALINILLGLWRRKQTGRGLHLDISMTDNLFTWLYSALGQGLAGDKWPVANREMTTGASPRYQLYATRDGRHLAIAALEERFWRRLCEVVGLSHENADDKAQPDQVRSRLAEIIATRRADEWEAIFHGEDVCCNVVRSVGEAFANPHFAARGLFDRKVIKFGKEIPALPVPLVRELQRGGDETYSDS